MLPPQIKATLHDQLQMLVEAAHVKAELAKLETAKDRHKTSKQKRIQTDYTELIRVWYQSIPPAARQRRYTTDELLTRFAGRYRDRPAVRMIGAALRANGFTPRRDWTVAGRNTRHWSPPEDK